jgi:sugar phosphate isomerase/epimerase
MKYSIAVAPGAPDGYPAIYKKNMRESIKKAREFGYTGIEWHLRRPDPAETEAIGQYCEALQMAVCAIGTGLGCTLDGLTLTHADRDVRMRAVERLKEFIDMAQVLKSLVIIGSIKGKCPPDEEKQKYLSYLLDGLKDVMDYAEKKNMLVVLEALNRYETNLLTTAEQTHEFVQRVGSRFLKTHIDTFHMNIEEQDMDKSIEKCRETLGHVHLADSNRWYPGAGHIDFRAVLLSLKKIGYQGEIGIECLPYPAPDIAAKNAVGYLSSITDLAV